MSAKKIKKINMSCTGNQADNQPDNMKNSEVRWFVSFAFSSGTCSIQKTELFFCFFTTPEAKTHEKFVQYGQTFGKFWK
jgi:hypothetical protein